MPVNSMTLLGCERRAVAPDHQRVVVIGEVDLATGLRLTDTLRAAQGDARHVVLDLGETTFIDASGVRILLAAAEHARATTGTFEIAHATAPVTRLLTLTGADRMLNEPPAANLPPPKGAGDGSRAASPLRARSWPSLLPSPSPTAHSR